MARGTCGHPSLAYKLCLPSTISLNSCPAGLQVGILAVLSAFGPDPEKRPVQDMQDGSGLFGKGIPKSWVPVVSSRERLRAPDWCVLLAMKGGHGPRRAGISMQSREGGFLAHKFLIFS